MEGAMRLPIPNIKFYHILVVASLLALLIGILIGWCWPRVGRYEYVDTGSGIYLYFDTATGAMTGVNLKTGVKIVK